MEAQWFAHLPLMLKVLWMIIGSGVKISMSKHAPLMSFARMTLKGMLISGYR